MRFNDVGELFKQGFFDGQIDRLLGSPSLKNDETYQAEYLNGYMAGWNRQERVATIYRRGL